MKQRKNVLLLDSTVHALKVIAEQLAHSFGDAGLLIAVETPIGGIITSRDEADLCIASINRWEREKFDEAPVDLYFYLGERSDEVSAKLEQGGLDLIVALGSSATATALMEQYPETVLIEKREELTAQVLVKILYDRAVSTMAA